MSSANVPSSLQRQTPQWKVPHRASRRRGLRAGGRSLQHSAKMPRLSNSLLPAVLRSGGVLPAHLVVNVGDMDRTGQDEFLHIIERFEGEPHFTRANARKTFWLRLYRSRTRLPHDSGLLEFINEFSCRHG